MVVTGVLTLDQAFAAIDMHILLLLLGMMIITVYLRTAGFFELMADKILSLSATPLQLLIFVILSSGLLSALFVNDTICLLYTPIILEITAQLGVNSMPYLIALATSSNIGSVMHRHRQSTEHVDRHLFENSLSLIHRSTVPSRACRVCSLLRRHLVSLQERNNDSGVFFTSHDTTVSREKGTAREIAPCLRGHACFFFTWTTLFPHGSGRCCDALAHWKGAHRKY